MKCQVRWIDKLGKITPDENEATHVIMFHSAYGPKEDELMFICSDHKAMIEADRLNFAKTWSLLPKGLNVDRLPVPGDGIVR